MPMPQLHFATLAFLILSGAAVAEDEWPTYGHDSGGMRHSPLTQIKPDNVARLIPAWTYHMRPTVESGRTARFLSSQVTPLVVDGVMYITTPYRNAVALDATTGKEIWVYEGNGPGAARRGVEYWP